MSKKWEDYEMDTNDNILFVSRVIGALCPFVVIY